MENVIPNPPFKPTYLGDGVYASFDGYQIWLHVGHHANKPCVALDSCVLLLLNEYNEKVRS